MTNHVEVANAQLLAKEEADAIKNYKQAASEYVIERDDVYTFEQFKFQVIIEANKQKLDKNVIKALASRAGIYNILQAAGYGIRTHVGFVPSKSAMLSKAFIVGHYAHSKTAVFKIRKETFHVLVRGVITYAINHPEVALSSKQANTRLLRR